MFFNGTRTSSPEWCWKRSVKWVAVVLFSDTVLNMLWGSVHILHSLRSVAGITVQNF